MHRGIIAWALSTGDGHSASAGFAHVGVRALMQVAAAALPSLASYEPILGMCSNQLRTHFGHVLEPAMNPKSASNRFISKSSVEVLSN